MNDLSEKIGAGHGEKQSRFSELAITALLTSPTVRAAAKKSEVSEATLRRWMADEGFAAEYRAARNQILDATKAALVRNSLSAVRTLAKMARSAKTGATARATAAKAILEYCFRAQEIDELAAIRAELTALEKRTEGTHVV